MSNILALETSSPVLSVAVKSGGRPVTESAIDGFMKHSENLLTVVDSLLKQNSLTINDIDTYLIGRGPGSFTGLRIGFATLKGFLACSKKNVFGALSLDMIADAIALPEKSLLAVCLNAYREKVYTRFYEKSASGWNPKTDAETLNLPDLLKKLPAGVTLTGDALEKYQPAIEKETFSKNVRFLGRESWYPKASSMISNFLTDQTKFSKLETPADLIPLYFRLSEAEERRQEHAGSC